MYEINSKMLNTLSEIKNSALYNPHGDFLVALRANTANKCLLFDLYGIDGEIEKGQLAKYMEQRRDAWFFLAPMFFVIKGKIYSIDEILTDD